MGSHRNFLDFGYVLTNWQHQRFFISCAPCVEWIKGYMIWWYDIQHSDIIVQAEPSKCRWILWIAFCSFNYDVCLYRAAFRSLVEFLNSPQTVCTAIMYSTAAETKERSSQYNPDCSLKPTDRALIALKIDWTHSLIFTIFPVFSVKLDFVPSRPPHEAFCLFLFFNNSVGNTVPWNGKPTVVLITISFIYKTVIPVWIFFEEMCLL